MYHTLLVRPWATMATTIATTLAAALLLSGCGQQAAPPAVQAPPAAVKVITSRSATVPVVDEYVGRIAAYRSVEIRARVEGILEQRLFVEGADVVIVDAMYGFLDYHDHINFGHSTIFNFIDFCDSCGC
jgi:membrane fusion protein (multidrug efflux system)